MANDRTREVLVLTEEMLVAEEAWAAEQREALHHRSRHNDYTEARAEVAGDATLAYRLDLDEDPREILASVRAQVAEEIIRDARNRDARQRELGLENER